MIWKDLTLKMLITTNPPKNLLLAGISLLAFAAIPAHAVPSGCVDGPVAFGSISSPCKLGNYTFEFLGLTGGVTDTTNSFNFDTENFAFGVNSPAFNGTSGSFDFTVTADSGRYFTNRLFAGAGGSIEFNPSASFPNSNEALTSVSGTYSWTASNNSLVQFQTAATTQVPAPLPFLGAGLAFGFTRRLRKRITSAS